jgi:hypothetical protein
VDDDDDPMRDQADADESIFVLRVVLVEDRQVVDLGREQLGCFREGQAVVPLVAAILVIVPLELHISRL